MNKTEQGWYEELMNKEHYDLQSEIYYYRYFKNIPNVDILKVLNFGSGLGQYTAKLKNVVCYEINETALDYLRKNNINFTNNINNLKDDYFDYVFCSFCLEHTEYPYKELQNMYKKLKKGGKLILIISNIKNYIPDEFEIQNIHSNDVYNNWTFTSINNNLIKAGFIIKENGFLGYKGNKYFYKMFPFKVAYFLTWFCGLFFYKPIMEGIAVK